MNVWVIPGVDVAFNFFWKREGWKCNEFGDFPFVPWPDVGM
jgi:hypothetical protein